MENHKKYAMLKFQEMENVMKENAKHSAPT